MHLLWPFPENIILSLKKKDKIVVTGHSGHTWETIEHHKWSPKMAREIAEKLTKEQQQQLWNEQWEQFHNWSPDTARETHMDKDKLEWSEHF